MQCSKTKIRNSFRILILSSTLLFTDPGIYAQDSSFTRPPVTNDWKEYKAQVLHDSSKKMLELREFIPSIHYDLRYATTNNFMHRRMYPKGTRHTYMRAPAVRALQRVQQSLDSLGLGLKIFDAYRPYAVTVKFWELVKDERYVANPSKGSGHNRGIAVDLTIIHKVDGRELDMGTGFDNFTDTAHSTFTALPGAVMENRNLLKRLMERNGFVVLETEWWHFYLPESAKYEVLDLDIRSGTKF
jgi:D-alanyl-D-alanine dipeptidase